jgi:hypothetical protein
VTLSGEAATLDGVIRHLARLAVGLGLGAALFVGLGAATLQTATAATPPTLPYGPTTHNGTISVSSTGVTAGVEDTVCGTGFGPSEKVTITLDGIVVGSTTSSPTGAWCATITIPAGLAPGTYTLVARDTSGHSKSISIVVAASSPGGSGGTPTTVGSGGAPLGGGGGGATVRSGGISGGLLGLIISVGAAAIIALGGWWLLAAKRRKREEEEEPASGAPGGATPPDAG